MTRLFTLCPAVALVCVVAVAAPASAQVIARPQPQPVTRLAALAQADLYGIVLDERGNPVQGAVVSALGSTSVFAVSDRDGRFTFRNLPSGPYLVRAHLQGYLPARGRIIQVSPASRDVSTIALTRRPDAAEPATVLAAGVGPAGAPAGTSGETETDDHSEVAWRLRHLKRSVLKDASTGLIDLGKAASFEPDPQNAFMRAAVGSARLASSFFADFPVNGQINLLTRTSFDRPQDLFSANTWMMPAGIAYLSLQAPTAGGEWSMRGAMTQGDLSSWILSGAYERSANAVHQYETGMSYGMQRYLGGNADALAAVSDGSRNVGAVYAYDNWAVTSRLAVNYGAKYERYDYLADRGQLSPRASVTLTPAVNGKTKVRAMVSRRALAPGAEEFVPPYTGLWLPPERTFSPVSARRGFTAEHVDHFEVGAERGWPGDVIVGVRAFRQQVDDQLVTLFGVAVPGTAAANIGHYYVASAGDFAARGWGVSVSRAMTQGVRASIDYTQIESEWLRRSPDRRVLSTVAPSLVRSDEDRFHDLTTSIESVVPATATRVFMIYKINTGLPGEAASLVPRTGTRFDLQINQSLPFLHFTSAQWEMLVAVRNLFREELLEASVYDELLVMRPPKRMVGGVTVRF
jgi:hypothetical protein